MNGSQFDTLVKQLATRRLTRGQTLRGLAAAALMAVAVLRLVAEGEAKGKGKRRRKKPVCTCSPSGCSQLKTRSGTGAAGLNPRCTYAGACTTNPCAATCSPVNDTQGTCPPGQICSSSQGSCVAGCTATTDRAQGSCPAGQICVLFRHFEIPVPSTNGQCQTGPVCTPACQPTEVCCPADTAQAGQCRSDRQACDEVPIPA